MKTCRKLLKRKTHQDWFCHHDHNCLVILFTIFVLARLGSGYDITDINFNNTSGLLLLVYNNALHSICHHGEPNTWGKREAIVSCKQLGYHGGWPTEMTVSNGPSLHLFNFDCDGTEKDIKNCGYEIADTCLNSKLAGINCYDTFDIRLVGGPSPNAGNVEVQYDDTWSNVCYVSRESETRQWSFYNAHVVCTELGFPGTMVARQGGFDKGIRTSIVDGFKCREDLRDQSLSECLPDTPRENATSCGLNNEAVAICAAPGYLGCYNMAALTTYLQKESTNMTTQLCRNHCRKNNYTHALLHASDTCSCGDDLSGKPLGDIECRIECAGNKQQTCGGEGAFSAYEVNSGVCDHPLNITGEYFYYGDIFEQTCKPEMEPVGTVYIQCVMGDPSNVRMWNASLPVCTERKIQPTSKTTQAPNATKNTTGLSIPGIIVDPISKGKRAAIVILLIIYHCCIILLIAVPYRNIYKLVKENQRPDEELGTVSAETMMLNQPQSDTNDPHDRIVPALPEHTKSDFGDISPVSNDEGNKDNSEDKTGKNPENSEQEIFYDTRETPEETETLLHDTNTEECNSDTGEPLDENTLSTKEEISRLNLDSKHDNDDPTVVAEIHIPRPTPPNADDTDPLSWYTDM